MTNKPAQSEEYESGIKVFGKVLLYFALLIGLACVAKLFLG